MTILQSRNIKIVEYLNALAIEPVRIRGKDYWYRSPFRSDTHPSFSVNTEKNLWFDLGSNEGGDIVKLVQLIYSCNVSEALHHIENTTPVPVNISDKITESHIDIIKVGELKNQALIKYITSRGISYNVASKYLQDIYYEINKKRYFALGFQNNSGGYELRSKYVKIGCLPKDITTIINGSENCCLFEGFMDMLSYVQYLQKKPTDHLILNGAALVNRAIEPLKKYKIVYFFGDNDDAGNKTFSVLINAGIDLVDCRFFYKGYKDLNEKFVIG